MHGGALQVPHEIARIVSGGQTGADRGGLDAAIELGIEHGGWCPHGRLAEDGAIAARYRLTETESPEYRVRTERNVTDSDGTALFTRGEPTGGSALTAALAKRHGRPMLHIDLDGCDDDAAGELLLEWLARHAIATLNIAGTRESGCPGLCEDVRRVLVAALRPR
jgi:hypothetical protein